MKISLCCIGRLENRYALEFVEHYSKLGVDKIFVYDNNYDGEEYFDEVLKDYIDSGIVEIVDYRNKEKCQLYAYQDCYDKHKNEYEWFCFFDFDEFIKLKNGGDLKSLLNSKTYEGYDMIHVNWMCYGDNDIVKYDNRKVTERFILPIMPLDFKKTYDFPENCHVKSIVRGGLDIKWDKTPHTPTGLENCCDSSGNDCDPNSPFTKILSYNNMFLRHYLTKTLEEWVNIKSKRGYPDGNKDFFKTHDVYDEFFKWNEKTDEKIKYIESLENNNDISNKLDIFICTHKDFEPIVKHSVYKQINCNNINNDTWNGLKGSFYSEIMSYFYIAENYELKDYVGFCHYRKYWSFKDDMSGINNSLLRNGIIVPKPIDFKITIREQYAKYHNIEDLYIVSGILAELYPEYVKPWNSFLNGKILFPYNMFIMKKEEFLGYIEFMKNILDRYVEIIGKDIEGRIENNKEKYLKDFEPNNEAWYQYRIAGYLAERLTNAWLIGNHTKMSAYNVEITEKKYNSEYLDIRRK